MLHVHWHAESNTCMYNVRGRFPAVSVINRTSDAVAKGVR